MDAITCSVVISRPREEVFEYLADIANHEEFSDHYLKQWHLTREDSYGLGAGARFRVAAPMDRFSWADVSFTEVTSPERIVESGHTGKFNRIRTRGVYTLTAGRDGKTNVEFSLETEPATFADRVKESMPGARGWVKRKTNRAMRRLRSILEEDADRGAHTTIASG